MAQQGKRTNRLFNLSTKPDDDLGERMMMGASPQSIGADLRAARQARGESTADVAHQLRLRESYIEAIESGNFETLPGVTYAIGFLRSYARYLRLDADDLIQRFKEEVSDIPPPADLAFLEPVSESRVPRGGLVALAILLAVGAYAGWYYLSTRDMTVADLVPAVPDQFANLVAPTEKSETPAPTAGPGGGGELTPPGPAGATVDNAPAESTAPPSTPSTSATAAATSASDASAEDGAPPAPEQLTSEQPAPNAAAEPKPAAPAQPATSATASGSTASRAIPDVPSVPSADGTAHSDSTASADSAGPRVYGEGNAGSRITLRANADSWIQVRAADESLLLTRTLRPGDTYRVPNQSGLRLMTGNAGGLEIIVDGKPIPSLGPVGAVKRNILLEPERLKAGTAAAN